MKAPIPKNCDVVEGITLKSVGPVEAFVFGTKGNKTEMYIHGVRGSFSRRN